LPPRGIDRGRRLGKLLILRMQPKWRRRWTVPVDAPIQLQKISGASVSRQSAQHASHRIRKIIMTVATVVDAIFATTMRSALQQVQFAQQFRVIRQADEAACKQRRDLKVNLRGLPPENAEGVRVLLNAMYSAS
jgi:hypothetical protein